jgi:hypothetical protein
MNPYLLSILQRVPKVYSNFTKILNIDFVEFFWQNCSIHKNLCTLDLRSTNFYVLSNFVHLPKELGALLLIKGFRMVLKAWWGGHNGLGDPNMANKLQP